VRKLPHRIVQKLEVARAAAELLNRLPDHRALDRLNLQPQLSIPGDKFPKSEPPFGTDNAVSSEPTKRPQFSGRRR
jgi:hypothetical protein